MNKILWNPNKEIMQSSSMMKLGKDFGFIKDNGTLDYDSLHNWSVNNPNAFWREVWKANDVIGNFEEKAFSPNKNIRKATFFPNTNLNFAENLLVGDDDRQAISFHGEGRESFSLTLKELKEKVASLAKWMKKSGVEKGDCVATLLPNCPETIITMLASSSLGAVFTSCSPDFGIEGILDRFGQSKPKILISCDGYGYGGKIFDIKKKTMEVRKSISSINELVFVDYLDKNNGLDESSWSFIIDNNKTENIIFERVPFNSPLYILYSSGTTGKPKCICHRLGGVLLQHLKEHKLHCEIKPGDNIFYFTTCGWMMWNWLVSALASEASIVLFDGFPMHKNKDLLFKIAEKEKISLLGVSAKFIDQLKKLKLNIKSKFNLKYLKTICSTGSPLSSEGFEYIYRNVKKNVHLSSISGGTDIVSCFVLGNIFSPVLSGEIQNNGLGMDVDVFSERGKSILNQKGELVCKSPFPSMPNKFWNDPGGKKYQSAYFLKYKNIWYHGDYAVRKKNGGYIIYGRSDATLNPGGVRLGTAEIYSVIENFKEVKESIVVGQKWDNDVRIILFVVMSKSSYLNDDIILRLKKRIRSEASPRHVPSKIIQVSDIPRTKNGKIVELAVKNTIEGTKIKNVQALANPNVLNEFKNLKQLQF